jgi:hypothetical protein
MRIILQNCNKKRNGQEKKNFASRRKAVDRTNDQQLVFKRMDYK